MLGADFGFCRGLDSRAAANECGAAEEKQQSQYGVYTQDKTLAQSRLIAELQCEASFELCQASIQSRNISPETQGSGRIEVSSDQSLVCFLREPSDFSDQSIALGPCRDSAGHQGCIVKPLEDPYYSSDVIRVRAALQKASCSSGCICRPRFLQSLAGAPVTDRNRNRFEKALVRRFIMTCHVFDKLDLGLFLSFRVPAFSGDIRAHGRHKVDAYDCNEQLQRHYASKNCQDRP